VITGHTRPELIHTFMTSESLLLSAPLAIEVQWYDFWPTDVQPPPDTTTVFKEGDPEWVQPERIAPIDALLQRLHKYAVVRPSLEVPKAIELSGKELAKSMIPLTDDRCPVLLLARALEDQGWTKAKQTIIHVSDELKVFDSRFATRMRWYFRALLHGVSRCVAYTTGGMPSQECMAYYRLLIQGIQTVPGLPAAQYQALLNSARRRKGQEIVPLPDWEKPPVLGDDTTFSWPLGDAPPPPKARGGGQGPRRPRSGRGLGRGNGKGHAQPPGPLALPLPPVPPAPPLPLPPIVEGEEETFVLPPPDPEPDDDTMVLPDPQAGPSDGPPARRQSQPGDWKDGIDGARICFTPYCEPGTGKKYNNYKITCPVHGPKCFKTKRSNYTATHGEVQPIAFLQAWREVNWPTDPKYKNHRQEDPTDMAVAHWVRDREAELVQARAQFP
jgi:hypothetical protein